jgi:hypothetical protein
VGFRVGNGYRICLWHDHWCGETPLKELFLVLFGCAANCGATVASLHLCQNDRVEWNVSFV